MEHEAEVALRATVALVNTAAGPIDALTSATELSELLAEQGFRGPAAGNEIELDDVRALRPQLAQFWRASDPETVAYLANRLLRRSQAMPQLVRHDDSWHLHVTAAAAPLSQRIAAEAAMGFIQLISSADLGRLKHCCADGCGAVLLDLSRNRSRLFCDTGNCGNREHVAAYRARKLHAAAGRA